MIYIVVMRLLSLCFFVFVVVVVVFWSVSKVNVIFNVVNGYCNYLNNVKSLTNMRYRKFNIPHLFFLLLLNQNIVF